MGSICKQKSEENEILKVISFVFWHRTIFVFAATSRLSGSHPVLWVMESVSSLLKYPEYEAGHLYLVTQSRT
jgi:hypothetical protein